MGKIGGWLQVGANVGILAGLILVGLQMQQNERLFKIQLVNQFNESQATLEANVGGEELATTWAKAVETPGELTLAEMRALEAVLYAPLIQWINLYRLHESGVTGANEWKPEVIANAGYFYGSAYGRAWWETMSEIFEPPFLPKELEIQIEKIVKAQSPKSNAGLYEAIKRRAIEIQDAPLDP